MLEMDPFARYPTYESLHKDMSDALAPLREAKSGKKPVKKKSSVVPVVIGLVSLALIAGVSYLGVLVFKARQAEKLKREQFEADKAAGRIKQVFRAGKLQWVRVEPESPAGGTAAADPAGAPATEWTLRAVDDVDITGDNQVSDLKDLTSLDLRAGSNNPLEDASKIYLRFSLEGVDRDRLKSAVLQITAGRRGSRKAKANPYLLHVWALKKPSDWTDLMRWNTAPGNDPDSATGLLADQAVRLASYDMPANPETGDRLKISDPALLDFIRGYSEDNLTLVLTADSDTDQKNGWRITSTEDAARFPPPTLFLKAK